nr:unnamed protein product [Callosobruchus analis]
MGDTSRKKRERPESYQRTKIKEAKTSGTQCKRNCFSKVSEVERLDMFTRFYNLKTKDEQDIFIQELIEITDVQNRRPRKAIRKTGLALTNISEHIEPFPKKESHYSGREVYYLDSNLFNIRYLMYQQISYAPYKFFVENFKLFLGRPQVDVCGTCETYKIKIKDDYLNETAKGMAEYLVHKRRTKKFYSELKSETQKVDEPHILALCFDFMQNIQLPATTVGDAFYYNELTTNVFCIHNIKKNKTTFTYTMKV